GEDVAAEPLRVEVVVEMRGDRAAEQDGRGARLTELQRSLAVPGRHEVEHLVCGVLHTHALEMWIPVVDVDELRAALVCARGQRARQLFLAEAAADVEDLARLDVGAEVDDEIGVALETVLHGQAILTPARMLAHARAGCDRTLSRITALRRFDAARLSLRRRGVRPLARKTEAAGRRRRRPGLLGVRDGARPGATTPARAGDDLPQARRRP